MLDQICEYLGNWFDHDASRRPLPGIQGDIRIQDGGLTDFVYLTDEFGRPIRLGDDRLYVDTGRNGVRYEELLRPGQYYRVLGSVFNDGVHLYGPEGDALVDERFHGRIQPMAVPAGVRALAGQIQEWYEANQAILESPYQSESFGGYRYDRGGGDGSGVTWQSRFGGRLAPWRRV